MRILVLLCFLAACSQAPTTRGPSSSPRQTDWLSYVMEEVYPHGLHDVFPDAQYLQNWQTSSEVVFDKRPPMPHQLSEIPLACKDKRLWPTHPQEYTKEYLMGVYANYQTQRVPPTSQACQTPNTTRRYCLRSTWANILVISDTYEDNCGNLYRGYWAVPFLKSDESMGTLLSKGRTVYPKPHAQFAGDYEEGQTYEVKESDFILLTPLNKMDASKIKQAKEQALSKRFRLQGKIFLPK